MNTTSMLVQGTPIAMISAKMPVMAAIVKNEVVVQYRHCRPSIGTSSRYRLAGAQLANASAMNNYTKRLAHPRLPHADETPESLLRHFSA